MVHESAMTPSMTPGSGDRVRRQSRQESFKKRALDPDEFGIQSRVSPYQAVRLIRWPDSVQWPQESVLIGEVY